MVTVWSPIRRGIALGGVGGLVVAAIATLAACSDQPNFAGSGGSPGSTGSTAPVGQGGEGGDGSPTTTSGVAQGGGGESGGACSIDGDCPVPGAPCLSATCDDGVCGSAPRPPGTPIADATGNCQTSRCDDVGALENVLAPEDFVDDGNPCTVHSCQAIGAPTVLAVAAGDGGTDEGGGCVGVCQGGTSEGSCGWRLYTRTFTPGGGLVGDWSREVLSASWTGVNAPPLSGIEEAESTYTDKRLMVWHEDGSFYELVGDIWLPPRQTAEVFDLPVGVGIALSVAWRPEAASTDESMLLTTDEDPPRARSFTVLAGGAFVPQTQAWDPINEAVGDPEAPPQHLVPYEWGFTVQTAYIETPGWVVFWEGLGGTLYEFSGSNGGFDSQQPESSGLGLGGNGPGAGTIAAAWYEEGILYMIAP